MFSDFFLIAFGVTVSNMSCYALLSCLKIIEHLNLKCLFLLSQFLGSAPPDLFRARSLRPPQLQSRLQALEDLPRPPRVERGQGRGPQEEDHRELDDQDADHHRDQVGRSWMNGSFDGTCH